MHGLTLGGDDYVAKPFSLEELVARVRAVLRRTRGGQATAAVLRYADLEMDDDAHEVRRGDRRSSCRRRSSTCCATCWPTRGRVLSQGADPRPRLALRLRRRLERRRDVHQLPAQEGRRRRRGPADPDGARVRLRAAAAAGVDVAAGPPDRDQRPRWSPLGLLGAGIATRHYLDSFLVDRVDQQFASAQRARAATRWATATPAQLATWRTPCRPRLVRRPGHATGRGGRRSLRRHRQPSHARFPRLGPHRHLDDRRLPGAGRRRGIGGPTGLDRGRISARW